MAANHNIHTLNLFTHSSLVLPGTISAILSQRLGVDGGFVLNAFSSC